MTDNRHTVSDWERLGTAVHAARLRAGHKDMRDWALVVGRSSRILEGLERGEKVGKGTLREVENVLRWPPGHATTVLDDPTADLAPDSPRTAPNNGISLLDEERPLDAYTTDQLLDEVGARYTELAAELQRHGYAMLSERKDRHITRREALSPTERRRQQTPDQ